MNPLILLGVGALAVLALSQRGKKKNGQLPTPGPKPSGEPREEPHIEDEGEIETDLGNIYPYRIWRVYGQPTKYQGELNVGGSWVSGPMDDSLTVVQEDLAVMAEGMDEMEGEGDDAFEAVPFDPCEGALEGPFDQHVYQNGSWVFQGAKIRPETSETAAHYWCVVPSGNVPGMYNALLVEKGTGVVRLVYQHADPNKAASAAWFAVYNPEPPFPWKMTQLAFE